MRFLKLAGLVLMIVALRLNPVLGQAPATNSPAQSSQNVIQVTHPTGGVASLRVEQASWLLGKSLALATRLEGVSGDKEGAKQYWAEANALAKAMQLTLPPLPDTPGFWGIRKYLVDGETSIRAFVEKRYSEKCAGIFQLPPELMLSVMMYSPTGKDGALENQAELNQFLSRKLKVAAIDSGLKSHVQLRAYIDWIDANKPSGADLNKQAQELLLKHLKNSIQAGYSTESKDQTANRRVAWNIGKRLAIALVLKVRGKAENFEDEVNAIGALAKTIGVTLPDPPELKAVGDVFKARAYLFGDDTKSVRAIVQQQTSEKAGALIRLAGDLVFSGMLYYSDGKVEADSNQAKINAAVTNSLMAASMKAGLKEFEPLRDVVLWMDDSKESSDDFTRRKIKVLMQIGKMLDTEHAAAIAEPGKGPAMATNSRPVVSALVVEPKTEDDQQAEMVAGKYVRRNPREQPQHKVVELQPTLAACKKLFDEQLAEKMFQHFEKVYTDDELLQASPGQTAVRLMKITTDEMISNSSKMKLFPGGYKAVAKHLKPGFTIYEVKYVKPGETSGYRYDGLVKIDGEWYFLFKMWRALQSEQPTRFKDPSQ